MARTLAAFVFGGFAFLLALRRVLSAVGATAGVAAGTRVVHPGWL